MATKVDLKELCSALPGDQVNGRYDLSRPIVRDGFIYISDARIILRAPCEDPDTDCSDPKLRWLTNIGDNVWSAVPDDSWEPWPDLDLVYGFVTCGTCDGAKIVDQQDCEECDGKGVVECESCGNEEDCYPCHGSGKIAGTQCPTCSGLGRVIGPLAQKVGDLFIPVEHDELLRTLPYVEWNRQTIMHGQTIRIRLAGADGAICGKVVLAADIVRSPAPAE